MASGIIDIDGIQVWAFFKRWSITEIHSNSDDLVFEIGMANCLRSPLQMVYNPPSIGMVISYNSSILDGMATKQALSIERQLMILQTFLVKHELDYFFWGKKIGSTQNSKVFLKTHFF